jgi:hypothetical protein
MAAVRGREVGGHGPHPSGSRSCGRRAVRAAASQAAVALSSSPGRLVAGRGS